MELRFFILLAFFKIVLSCRHDYDCGHIKGAQCYDDQPHKVCDCPVNFVMNIEGNECLPIAKQQNDKCDESSQCMLGLFAANCIDNRCKCRKNYHFSAAFKKCIRNKIEGDLCKKEDDNCYQLGPDGKNILRCINGLCLHLKHDEVKPKRPNRVSTMTRVCNIDDDCVHINGAKCLKSGKSRSCKCSADQVISSKGTECLPIVREVDHECSDTIQCSAGMFAATCVQNKCQCWKDYRFYEKIDKCIRIRVYGDPCSEEVDGCYQLAPDGNNALECVEDVCKCRPYFKFIDNKCQIVE